MKPALSNDTTSWQIAPYGTSTWATFSSLGTDVYGTWVSKTFGAGTEIAQESWIGLSFAAYWQDYDNTADYEDGEYFKDSCGIVHVKGLVETTSTSAGATIATLPVGYRPSKHCVFAQYSADGAIRINVYSTGEIIASTGWSDGNNEWLSLAGITFDTR